jgi:hypothetical protein
MDDETDRPEKRYPLSPGKMSKTPSWVMVGFVLGALTVYNLPPLRRAAPPRPAEPAKQEAPTPAARPSTPPLLTKIEAVFQEWAPYAVWEYDATEVALWSSETSSFSEFFEVRRYADRYYFRSIPALTRRIITHGRELPNSPLQFTETEEQYQDWVKHGRRHQVTGDYRPVSAFSEAASPPKAQTDSAMPRIRPPSELFVPELPKGAPQPIEGTTRPPVR